MQVNRQIGASLTAAKKELDKETKLLLLGTGESGKSTFAKQMHILHMSGFDAAARASYKRVVHGNVLENALSLVHGAEALQIAPSDPEACAEMKGHDGYDEEDFVGLKELVARVWADEGIQQAFGRRDDFQLSDNCAFFMGKLDALAAPDYVPDEQDILRARSKTTGILETVFTIAKITFRMVDVGGQRSERKKWIHCFQDVTALIFCVSLSEYNQTLDEDNRTPRMVESLRLFRQIVNSPWFGDSDLILFLNKRDLLEQKIAHHPLTVAFPQYSGPSEFAPAAAYIQKQFVSQADDSKKKVYAHITCATDSSNIQLVFSAVRQMLMSRNMDESGLGTI